MTFEDVWREVQALLDTAKLQIPGVLKDETKKRLSRRSPEKIKEIVEAAIEEVNHGSIVPLDELVKKRL